MRIAQNAMHAAGEQTMESIIDGSLAAALPNGLQFGAWVWESEMAASTVLLWDRRKVQSSHAAIF